LWREVRIPVRLFSTAAALGELRRAERNVDGTRIVEEYMIVSVGVAVGGRPAHPAAGAGSFQRMGFEDPVANVDDVNVLFHDDVAGKSAVVDPIAQAALRGRSIGPGWPIDVTGKVVRLARRTRGDFEKFPAVDFVFLRLLRVGGHFSSHAVL
jgi:hypothetical protein